MMSCEFVKPLSWRQCWFVWAITSAVPWALLLGLGYLFSSVHGG